jgi:hypothetical protein
MRRRGEDRERGRGQGRGKLTSCSFSRVNGLSKDARTKHVVVEQVVVTSVDVSIRIKSSSALTNVSLL